jgi:short-subunit dehydrogenase
MQHILIIGATSAIAVATARLYAQRGDHLHLMARDARRLEQLAADLRVRGATEVTTAPFDALATATHEETIAAVFEQLPSVDVALLAHGSLPDQAACEQNAELALREIQVNAVGTVSVLGALANRMATQGSGCIAVITSVAGDRGRQSNYIYGASKAMVSTYLQGLRNRLFSHGVQVLDIRPGFVDTPMTADFDKGLLWAQPDAIARAIVKGVEKGRGLIYTPFFWRYILWVIRMIPEPLFKRMKL